MSAHVTVPDQATVTTYSVTASQSVFSFSWTVFAKADIRIRVGLTDLAQSDFTFTGTPGTEGGFAGGTVTLNTAVSSTTVVISRRVIPMRTGDFGVGPVATRDLNTELDRLTAMAQDARRDMLTAEPNGPTAIPAAPAGSWLLGKVSGAWTWLTTAPAALVSAFMAPVLGAANANELDQAAGRYATRAAAIAARPATLPTELQTKGYAAPYDGGGALWVQVASEPVHEGKLMMTASGGATQWYELASGQTIYVEQFGCVAGRGLNATQRQANRDAMQNCIDYATYFAKCPANLWSRVYEAGGNAAGRRTLHLGYGHTFAPAILKGFGGPSFLGEGAGAGTAIWWFGPRTDPALNIQGGRQSRFENVFMRGLDFDYYAAAGQMLAPHIVESWWDAPGGNGRYNPYAGITLDAYTGTRPTPSYSDVTYPAWTSISTQWGRSPSSQTQFDNVGVGGFNTAFVGHPSGSDGNGDYNCFNSFTVFYCKYALSQGHTQARNLRINNMSFVGIWNLFATNVHGKQQGRLELTADGISGSSAVNLFSVNGSGVTGQSNIRHLYCEVLYRLGDIVGAGLSGSGIVIDSAGFEFTGQASSGSVPANLLGGTGDPGTMEFRDCSFTNFIGAASFLPSGVRFTGFCKILPQDRDAGGPIARHLAHFHNCFAGGMVAPLSAMQGQGQSFQTHIYSVDNGGVGSRFRFTTTGSNMSLRSRCVPWWCWKVTPWSEASADDKRPYTHDTARDWSGFSSVSYDAATKTLTIVWSSLSDAFALEKGGLPGDVIVHNATGTVFVCRSRTTTTTLWTPMNNIVTATGALITSISFTSGAIALYNNRRYQSAYRNFGNMTAGSAVIASVSTGNGSTSLHADIAVGDALVMSGIGEAWEVAEQSGGITANIPGTITLTTPVAASHSRIPLINFVRTGAPNA